MTCEWEHAHKISLESEDVHQMAFEWENAHQVSFESVHKHQMSFESVHEHQMSFESVHACAIHPPSPYKLLITFTAKHKRRCCSLWVQCGVIVPAVLDRRTVSSGWIQDRHQHQGCFFYRHSESSIATRSLQDLKRGPAWKARNAFPFACH